jgi:hypothetical protein
MAGLFPAIHDFALNQQVKVVDGRHKASRDVVRAAYSLYSGE